MSTPVYSGRQLKDLCQCPNMDLYTLDLAWTSLCNTGLKSVLLYHYIYFKCFTFFNEEKKSQISNVISDPTLSRKYNVDYHFYADYSELHQLS